jgi:hypothetical protein
MLTTSEMKTLQAFFAKMDKADLNAVREMYNRQHRIVESQACNEFNIGDKVQFISKRGETVVGTITKVNRKTIKLTAVTGGLWSVSPGLLTKV